LNFLCSDEIGELPPSLQVKLLRPLQEREVVPVGASAPIPVDVRIFAATHRNLVRDVRDGRFREDLFYRLAIAVLRLPAVREREGDLTLLVDHVLNEINSDNRAAGIGERSLTPSGRRRLLRHSWPGNVRELANTLRRAAVWSSTSVLDASDIEDALLPVERGSGVDEILERPLGPGFSLDAVLDEVQEHYIAKALELAQGKKVEAARLLGFNSHQVLTNRLSSKRGRSKPSR
jgi:DNA-binding NtrC family response regulator